MHFLCRYEDSSSNPQNLCKLGHSRAHLQFFSGSYCKNWAQENPQELTGYKVWHRQQLVRNPIPNNGEGKGWNPMLSSDLHMNATACPNHNHREARVYSLLSVRVHTHTLYNYHIHLCGVKHLPLFQGAIAPHSVRHLRCLQTTLQYCSTTLSNTHRLD